jgi:hypothetical protein
MNKEQYRYDRLALAKKYGIRWAVETCYGLKASHSIVSRTLTEAHMPSLGKNEVCK